MNTDKPATISLADEEAVKEVLVSTVFGLWDIVNNLTRLQPSRRERYRVTIFGSARAKPGTFVYDEVKRVAAALAGNKNPGHKGSNARKRIPSVPDLFGGTGLF